MPQQKDIVKIAIQMPGAYPQLIQLDQVSISTQERSLSQRVEGEKKLLNYQIRSGKLL